MVAITAGDKCGMKGDYLAWDDMEFNLTKNFTKIKKISVTNITLTKLCKQDKYTEIKTRGSLLFWDAHKTCKKMWNSHMYTPISKEHAENSTIRGCPWLPFSDAEEEGVWKHVDTGVVTNYTQWATGRPNGGRRANNVQGCKSAWYDCTNAAKLTAMCINFMQPIFRIRGMCKETRFPALYSPFNYGDTSTNMVYFSYGQFYRQTIIKYDSESSSWVMAIMSKSGNFTNATTVGMGLKICYCQYFPSFHYKILFESAIRLLPTCFKLFLKKKYLQLCF